MYYKVPQDLVPDDWTNDPRMLQVAYDVFPVEDYELLLLVLVFTEK